MVRICYNLIIILLCLLNIECIRNKSRLVRRREFKFELEMRLYFNAIHLPAQYEGHCNSSGILLIRSSCPTNSEQVPITFCFNVSAGVWVCGCVTDSRKMWPLLSGSGLNVTGISQIPFIHADAIVSRHQYQNDHHHMTLSKY